MITIQRNYINCKLDGDLPDKVFQELRQAMRYSKPGYRFSYVYKKGWGDGYVYLITPKRRIFPSGLLYVVEKILSKHDIDYTIKDMRVKPVLSDPIPLKDKELRYYQQDAEDVCLKQECGVVKIPTGGGKTLIFTSLIGKLNGIKCIVYVRKLDLMRQTIQNLKSELGIEVGQVGGGTIDIKDVSVVMIPTAARALGEKYVKYTGHENDDDDDSTPLSDQQKLSIKKYIEEAECFIIDECFPADTIIQTEDGPQRIGTLVNQHYAGKVWSYDTEKDCMELKPVSNWYKRATTTPLCRVKLHPTKYRDCVTCTENHKFYVLDGSQVKAKDLNAGDIVRTFLPIEKRGRQNSSSKARCALNDDQVQVALGSVLGDGYLYPYKSGRVARLQFTHCEEQEEYCKWKLSVFGCEDKLRLQKGGYGHRVQRLGRTYGWWQLSAIHRQTYQNKKKIITRELLNQLKPLGIAVWIMDDGSWAPRSETYTLHTEGYSYEEQKTIQEYFDAVWQLKTAIHYNKSKDKYFLYFNKRSSALLRKIVAPHLHPSMLYKGGMDGVLFQEVNKEFLPYGLAEVYEIEKNVQLYQQTKDGKHCVFNITVDDNHNYIANGFLVSNCHCISSESAQMVSKHSKKAYYRLGFCLIGNSVILTEQGPQKIQDLYDKRYVGKVWAHTGQGTCELQSINHITKRIPEEDIYKIKTFSGLELCVTGNHPILTDDGYQKAGDLVVGSHVVSTPYMPGKRVYDFEEFYNTHSFVTYDQEAVKADLKHRMLIEEKVKGSRNRETKHKLIKAFGKVGNFDAWWAGREVPHMRRFIERLKQYNLTEYDIGMLYGIMLGDGHLMKDGSSYALIYTSNVAEVEIVADYLAQLSIPFSCYSHQGEWTPNDVESDCKQIKISGVLPRFFAEVGFPLGKKTEVEYSVSSFVMTGNRDVRVGFLRGFFFADGSVYQQNNGYQSIEVKLSQVKEKTLDDSLLCLLHDVSHLLSKEHIKTSLFWEKYEKSKRGVYVLSEGKARFLRTIGFWQGPKQRTAFKAFKTLLKLEIATQEWLDKVISIEVCEKEPVYDIINVRQTHNFIANNIVVHNSATPWRTDGTDILINAVTGPKIVDIKASTLITEGYLVPPRVHFYKVPRNWREKVPNDYQKVYNQFIVENEARNKKIVDLAKYLVEQGERPVILVQRKLHGKNLESALLKQGLIAKFIFGESSTTERVFTLDQFESGILDVLIGSTILNEGIDLPCITALINASGGKSSSAYYQKIGRAIRTHEDKTRAIIVDFIDSVKWLNKHSKERIKVLETEPLYQIKIQGDKNGK